MKIPFFFRPEIYIEVTTKRTSLFLYFCLNLFKSLLKAFSVNEERDGAIAAKERGAVFALECLPDA